jgi:hypothetical protein
MLALKLINLILSYITVPPRSQPTRGTLFVPAPPCKSLSASICNSFVERINRTRKYYLWLYLGTIQTTQAPVVWTVGYTTDPAVNYINLSGAAPTPRSPYYKSRYSNDEALASNDGISRGDDMSNILVQIVDFSNDFSNASPRAQQLDNKILQDAACIECAWRLGLSRDRPGIR